MLASFRRTTKTWAAGAILFLALLAMVITGFGTGGMGGLESLAPGASSGTLATVEGKTLTESEANDIINRQYALAREQSPTLDLATFATSAFDPIVDQLILALAIQAFGQDQGLVVTQHMVDREIVGIPAFRNFAGQFDETSFRAALARQNLTEAQLREDIARSLMQRQLLGPIARGAAVPDGVARAYSDLLLERRRGTIGVVPEELLRAGITPTDAEVAAFYQQNRARFTIPERRVIRYAVIGPEQVAATARATDAEIATFYRENQATYGPRETRDLHHIVLPDQAAAAAFVQRIRGGTGFTEAAGQAGFGASDVTFADQSREAFAQVAPAPVVDAAFGAAEAAVTGPVQSELGFHVVQVTAIEQVPGRPIASVRDEIATQIEQRKLAMALDDLVSRIDDRLADGASIEEIAQAEGLSLTPTPPLTAEGRVPGETFVLPPDLQPVVRAGYEIDGEDPEPLVEQLEPNSRFALVGLERVIPAAPPPLAQIRDAVREALVRQRALARARALADQLAARINGGTAPAAAFAAATPNLPSPEAIDLQRLEITRAGEQAPAPLVTLFSIAEGRAEVIPAPNGAGWFVVHHAARTAGDAAGQPELIASTRNEFNASIAEEIAQQFARAVESVVEVERNAEAIRAARQRMVGSSIE